MFARGFIGPYGGYGACGFSPYGLGGIYGGYGGYGSYYGCAPGYSQFCRRGYGYGPFFGYNRFSPYGFY